MKRRSLNTKGCRAFFRAGPHAVTGKLQVCLTMTTMVCMTAGLMACANPGAPRKAAELISPGAAGLRTDVAALPDSDGWQMLGDPELDRLIGLALQGNPGMMLARARLGRALALAELSHANAGVSAGLGVDFSSQHYSANGLIPKPIAGNTWESGTVQTTLNWSPDFFGQHAAEWASAIGQARASRADEAMAALNLRTQISRSYVALARLVALREVEQKALAQREHILRLTNERVKAGLDSRVELIQAGALPPESRGRIEAVDEQVLLLQRQIAVLCGLAPDSLQTLKPSLDKFSTGTVPYGALGLDLLGRRPDVVASRWRVEAAMQDVAQARSQFYPNINLSAFIGLSSLGLGQLFELGSRQMGIAPALRLPLFDSGRLSAQLGARHADLDGAIAQYNQSVLDAVREAGDAMSSAQSLAKQGQQQAQTGQAAELAHELTLRRYQAGLGNYLLVLNAETQRLTQRRLAIDLRARAVDNRLLLVKALGGGWKEEATAPLAAAGSVR